MHQLQDVQFNLRFLDDDPARHDPARDHFSFYMDP